MTIIHPGPRTPATPREPEPSDFVERRAEAVADAMFTYRGGRTSMPYPASSERREAIAYVRAALAAARQPTEWEIDTREGRAIVARRRPAYIAACRQNARCGNRGVNRGTCAYCADVGDAVVEAYVNSLIDESTK